MQAGFFTSGRGSPTNMLRFGILIALSFFGVECRIRRKQSVQIENVSGDAGRRPSQMNQLLGLVYKLGCD